MTANDFPAKPSEQNKGYTYTTSPQDPGKTARDTCSPENRCQSCATQQAEALTDRRAPEVLTGMLALPRQSPGGGYDGAPQTLNGTVEFAWWASLLALVYRLRPFGFPFVRQLVTQPGVVTVTSREPDRVTVHRPAGKFAVDQVTLDAAGYRDCAWTPVSGTVAAELWIARELVRRATCERMRPRVERVDLDPLLAPVFAPSAELGAMVEACVRGVIEDAAAIHCDCDAGICRRERARVLLDWALLPPAPGRAWRHAWPGLRGCPSEWANPEVTL